MKRVIGGRVSNRAAVESEARARAKSGEGLFFVYIFFTFEPADAVL